MSDDIVYNRLPKSKKPPRGTQWTPWVPEPIDTAPPADDPPAAPEPAPEEVEKRLKNTLARLRARAQEQGHAAGYAAGHAEGLQQGLADGHKQGYEEGHREGLDAGHAEGRQHAEEAAHQLATISQACAQALADIETEMGQAIIALATRIAGQVLHQTLESKPESIIAVMDNLLRMDTGNTGILQLYLNPLDVQLVEEYLADNPETRLWRIFPDDTITRGGCRARTALGDIDATLETRWQRVVASLGGGD